jgi:uridylate kinase
MKAVIRIGGSVIASPPSARLIQKYSTIIQNLRDKVCKLVVIVGGGTVAREYIDLARKAGLTEPEQDETAISVSRFIAKILAMHIGGLVWKTIPTSIEEALEILQKRGIVIMGGLRPGMTTDTVAAMIANEIDAKLIVKATDQDGVYTKDPKKYQDAKKLDDLNFDELDILLKEDKHKAGIHQIIDPEALDILKNKHIKTIIVNGFKPENLEAAIRGEKIGTTIM